LDGIPKNADLDNGEFLIKKKANVFILINILDKI